MSIKLIAGLGNIGKSYEQNRHNVGFWFVDILAEKYNSIWKLDKKFQAYICKIKINNFDVILIKPTTLMNLSGQAVKLVSSFYKILPKEVLIIHDELDLDVIDVKLKLKGGHGGHNGLRNIHSQLNTEIYNRIRIGISHPGIGKNVSNFVLSNPSKNEKIDIINSIDRAIDIIPYIVQDDISNAMNILHTK